MTQRDIKDTSPFGAELLAQARAQGVQLTPLNWTGFGKLSEADKGAWRGLYGANPGQTSVQGPLGFGGWYVTPGWAGVAQAPAELVKVWGTAFWASMMLGTGAFLGPIQEAAQSADEAVAKYLAASPSTAAQAYAMKPGVQRKAVGDGSKGRQSGSTVQNTNPIAAPAPGADVLGEARASKATMEAAIARHHKATEALVTALTRYNTPDTIEALADGPEELATALVTDPTMTLPEGVYLTPPALAPGVFVVLTPALRTLLAPVCSSLPPDGSTVGVVGIVAGPMVVLSLAPETGIVTPGGMYPAESKVLSSLARGPIVVKPPSPPAE